MGLQSNIVPKVQLHWMETTVLQSQFSASSEAKCLGVQPRLVLSLILGAAALLSTACATGPGAGSYADRRQEVEVRASAAERPEWMLPTNLAEAAERLAFKPRKPGTVLPSQEIAAVNALAYAYLSAHRAHSVNVMHGGTITKVEGGYVFSRPRAAGREGLRIPLGPADVAHYKTYPTYGRAQDVWGETHSPRDRAAIDRDGRPSYLLTPTLRVMVYRGIGSNEIQVAALDDRESLLRLKELASNLIGR